MDDISQSATIRTVSGPPHSGRSRPLAYVCAIASIGLAILVRAMLTRYIGTQFAFSTVYFAVVVTAWYGGLYPALVATALGFFGITYFIIPPLYTLTLSGLYDYIGACIYLFISLSTALFSEAQHKAQARAESSALEARRQEAAARASEARKSAILDTSIDAIITIDHLGRIVEFNPAAEKMFNVPRAAAIEKEMVELIIPASLRALHRAGMERYLATGEGRILGKRIETMALGSDGIEFPVEVAVTRIPGDGPPMFSGQIHDITTRNKNDVRQRFLAEASDLLAASLDFQMTLQSVAQLAVPQLADWCAVDMPAENGGLRRVAVSHADPAKIQLAHELDRRYPPDADAAVGAAEVMRTGKPELVADIPEEVLRAGTRDAEHYEIVRALGLRSYICVPLAARGRNLGAITFIGAESGHRYGPEDLVLAVELARRAAIAVDNSLLYQAERERSEQLTMAIQEVHHRVKNNLQAVSALLEMQISDDSNVVSVEAVHDSLSQIKTIALVHDLLTHDQPIGNVDATRVLAKMITMLSTTLGSPEAPLPIHLDADPMRMPVRAATALALALNELVNNAAKHSSSSIKDPPCHDAPIQIRLQQRQDEVLVTVRDSGPGFPPGFDPMRHAHVGLELVQTLVHSDLQGTILFHNGGGGEDAGMDGRGARVEIAFTPSRLCD